MVNIETLARQVDENKSTLLGIQRRLAEEQMHYEQQAEGLGNGTAQTEKENLMVGRGGHRGMTILPTCNFQLVEELIKAFEKVAADINRLLEQRAAASEESSSMEEEVENLYNQMDLAKQKLARNIQQQKEQRLPAENGGQQQLAKTALLPRENEEGGLLVEYGTLSSTQDSLSKEGEMPIGLPHPRQLDEDEAAAFAGSRQPRRKMSVGEQARLDTVTRLRSWLQASTFGEGD